jgi:hypothetical protein
MGDDLVSELVTRYQAGMPSTQLIQLYGLGKGTVLQLLREQGVAKRIQHMGDDEIREAAALYAAGRSLARVGQRLGRHPSAIQDVLKRAGVPRRDSQGRDRI